MRVSPFVCCALVWALVPGAAHAQCGVPDPILSAGASEALPPHASVFVFFSPRLGAPEVTALRTDGRKVKVRVTPLQGTPALAVWRVTIDAPPGTRFELSAAQKNGGRARRSFVVDGKDAAVTTEAPRIEKSAPLLDEWKCSYTRVQRLTLSAPAAAYEVDIPGAKPFLVPPAPNDTGAEAARSIALGHLSCIGHTWVWTGEVDVRVRALYSDGSTSAASGPVHLSPPPAPKHFDDAAP